MTESTMLLHTKFDLVIQMVNQGNASLAPLGFFSGVIIYMSELDLLITVLCNIYALNSTK